MTEKPSKKAANIPEDIFQKFTSDLAENDLTEEIINRLNSLMEKGLPLNEANLKDALFSEEQSI